MNKNNNEHLKGMLSKLKKLQEENKAIQNSNPNNLSIESGNENGRNAMLSKKLDEIRQKRMDLEKSYSVKNSNKTPSRDYHIYEHEQNQNQYTHGRVDKTTDMEFIAERGYSKTSYLKILSAIEGIKENLVKLSSTPSLNKILDSNIIISNGMNDVITAFSKVLPQFFESLINEKIIELERTDEINMNIKNSRENSTLSKMEHQINSLMNQQGGNNNNRNENDFSQKRSRDEDIDALELEMSLINNLLFKK